MLLFLTAIDPDQQTRNFTWYFTKIETCFDVLSELSATGNQLLRIELVDNDKHTILPVEIFDGLEFSTPIQALELEWKQILSYSSE
ncbi:hypothetical protein GCM10028818_00220 [Spirosoma horti]